MASRLARVPIALLALLALLVLCMGLLIAIPPDPPVNVPNGGWLPEQCSRVDGSLASPCIEKPPHRPNEDRVPTATPAAPGT